MRTTSLTRLKCFWLRFVPNSVRNLHIAFGAPALRLLTSTSCIAMALGGPFELKLHAQQQSKTQVQSNDKDFHSIGDSSVYFCQFTNYHDHGR